MKNFEEICREYEKTPVQVEKNLYLLLEHPEVRITAENVLDNDYYTAIKSLLISEEFIVQTHEGYKRTIKGEVAKLRGWVCIKEVEYKAQKIKQLLKDVLFYVSVLASILAAISSAIMLFR